MADASICNSVTYCTGMLIEDSSFSEIPYNRPIYSQAVLVNEANGVRLKGYVLTVDSARTGKSSSIELYGNQFQSIQARYDGY